MWFEKLTGFAETNPATVRKNLFVKDNTLVSRVNGRSWACGTLEIPTLATLRNKVGEGHSGLRRSTIREVIGNVQTLHASPDNAGALFQVASQFNLLEMASPDIIPEDGVDIYELDHTQGPACAIAAGAGTIYRNYFVRVSREQNYSLPFSWQLIGQSKNGQIDCLNKLGMELNNYNQLFWCMKNGYALATSEGLDQITRKLEIATDEERDRLRSLVRIGIQWNTEVTLESCSHKVSQAYCSALPVAYSRYPQSQWSAFAQLILEAAYEATFLAALLNAQQTGNRTLYLTLLGGGAFGNRTEWIVSAIERALRLHEYSALDVCLVSYGAANPQLISLLNFYNPTEGGI